MPFVVQNCGALPDNLIESELFGHEKGAFTGAQARKPGRVEIADGGTFFLDEVGELPLPLQTRLLRVLEDGEILAVGALRPVRVDVRWIAATNRDLAAEVAAGRFREDLFFRLKVIEVRIPPLRERLDDLPDLIETLRARLAGRLGREVPPLSAEAMDLLRAHDFPGNVRELENLLERAAVLSAGGALGPEDFPDLRSAPRGEGDPASSLKGMARAVTSAVEKREIESALEASGGNVTRAAVALGVSRRGLQNKMKEYGISRKKG
jgi:transcriptional regulator with PAS, ATPase and Fis domain